MPGRMTTECVETQRLLLGDEALALAAAQAGISGAYAYPGTPSTEILEFLLRNDDETGFSNANWCTNEKTAYEQALGMSMAGKRALVAMKHVGLNVAADPFINSALVKIDGGLVLAVADDPGMHSSQNEQDSRVLADFARTICLEPADQQEAYDMTREAFDLSERFRVPVVVRLVTRLAHSRGAVQTREPRAENPLSDARHGNEWILLPAFARNRWSELLGLQQEMRAFSEGSTYNTIEPSGAQRDLGVITAGIAREYFRENLEDLEIRPAHLHIGTYPLPVDAIREFAGQVKSLLIFEEGYPHIERYVRGLLPTPVEVWGKESGHVQPDGELTPGIVRWALGLPEIEHLAVPQRTLPPRPPRLCQGCPHCDAYAAINRALTGFDHPVVTSDIGCYTLGILPPYGIGESCVCMGASIGMAKGAAEAGHHPVVAIIGDSTFLHSGVTPLIDAVAADSDITVVILDNQVVAMTGSQPTILPSSRLRELVLGLGVDPDHCNVLSAHPKSVDQMADVLHAAIEHRGLSVVISHRECVVSARKRKRGTR